MGAVCVEITASEGNANRRGYRRAATPSRSHAGLGDSLPELPFPDSGINASLATGPARRLLHRGTAALTTRSGTCMRAP